MRNITQNEIKSVINAIDYYFMAVDGGYYSLAETLAEIIDNWLEKNEQRLPSCRKSGIINTDFNENDVVRDKLGRFADQEEQATEKELPTDSYGNSYVHEAVHLPKKEYGKVMHTINTSFDKKYKGKSNGILRTLVNGKYKRYFFEIHDFNEYNIYKVKDD